MSKKTTDAKVDEVAKVKEPIETLILRPRIKLTAKEFEVLEEQIELMNKKEGTKVILIPYSCEVAEDAE